MIHIITMSDPADLLLVYNAGALCGHYIQQLPATLCLSLGVLLIPNLKDPWFGRLRLRSHPNVSRIKHPSRSS